MDGMRRALGPDMGNTNKAPKKLSLKRETLRNLLDSELANVAGGGACCASRATAGCSTSTVDKCTVWGSSYTADKRETCG
jgi:hypothetical protein